jgi:predicted GIY-YIG superfamily endonuclease
MYYIYELQSEKDNAFYVGFTEDLKLRFALLNNASHKNLVLKVILFKGSNLI